MSSILLTASEFARVCQVTPRTIRWYQEKGLLTPKKVDGWNKYAYFAPDQALKVYRIKLLQQFNIPLKQITDLLNSKKPLNLNEELKRLEQFIKEKEAEFKFLREMELVVDQKKAIKLEKEKVGPFLLLVHRIDQGDYYKIDSYIRDLKNTADSLGIKYQSPAIAFYLDNGYNPKKANLEIALICEAKEVKNLPENLELRDFTKTTCLTFNFQGPYNLIEFAYQKLNKYIKANKIRTSGPVFEYYLNNPMNTNSVYDYLTKICFPL